MIEIIGIIIIIYSVYLLVNNKIKLKNNEINLKPIQKDPSMCILIPARDESKVIEELLKSIKNQSYKINMEDIYVIVESKVLLATISKKIKIVESKEDKTIDISKKYNVNIIFRENLALKRKGYALDEAIKQILKSKEYDLYFIFDADNVLDKNFIANMMGTYKKGYDIAIGYRNCKNGNDNVISACSSLTFSMINTIGNKQKIKNNANVILSGTGFYIKGDLINKWQGFPFHSLTEDYELSLYAILNNLTTYYNEEAIYYDEQPTKYKQTVRQRVRWIKGYFTSRKEYIPLIKEKIKTSKNKGSMNNQIIGVRPFIYLIIGIILILLKRIYTLIINKKITINLSLILAIFFVVYLIMLVITYIILKKEKLINLNKHMKIKAILFNPIYLTTYIPCAIKAILKKNVEWTKIEHGK